MGKTRQLAAFVALCALAALLAPILGGVAAALHLALESHHAGAHFGEHHLEHEGEHGSEHFGEHGSELATAAHGHSHETGSPEHDHQWRVASAKVEVPQPPAADPPTAALLAAAAAADGLPSLFAPSQRLAEHPGPIPLPPSRLSTVLRI